ncbi:hypothetical protein PRIPAC_73655 [Pristionchus pacificus]|nr:hypothetical protein PRIPAC_73655 [Pristionchus pacificus]
MAEFVEQSLEELVPVFEQLGATQLLSEKQVNDLVKRCRRYDYRLQKSHKKPEDYLYYGEYLSVLLDFIAERRNAIGYVHKKELIEFNIKRKTAGIYRRLCERFQGKLEYWLMYIQFTSTRNMKAQTSKAFIQAMQMHPRSLELRIKAARWEWTENNSVDNARRGLQLALRLHPESVALWATLFEIELDYVKKIKARRSILLEHKHVDDEEESAIILPATPAATDAVLQLRVAEIVMEQGLETIGALRGEERDGKMSELLVLLWRACLSLDASDADAARVRSTLEQRMAAQPDPTIKWRIEVDRQLAEGEDLMDALASKAWADASIDELRWAVGRLKEKADKDDDAVCRSKVRDLLSFIVRRPECTEEECDEWARGVTEVEEGEERAVVERAVERFPRRALFWRLSLEAAGKRIEEEVEEAVIKHAESINQAIDKAGDDADAEEAVRLYQLAIDLAVAHFPDTVEKVFRSCLDSSVGDTHRALKVLRVDYLLSIVEEEGEEEGRTKKWSAVEKKIRELVHRRPNSVEFYVHVAESLLALAASLPKSTVAKAGGTVAATGTVSTLDALIDETLAAAVAEHADSDDAWIARCELLMERAPLKVADVYRRAILSLKGGAAESFIARYTALQQAAAAK